MDSADSWWNLALAKGLAFVCITWSALYEVEIDEDYRLKKQKGMIFKDIPIKQADDIIIHQNPLDKNF